jgi:hypothetical protein
MKRTMVVLLGAAAVLTSVANAPGDSANVDTPAMNPPDTSVRIELGAPVTVALAPPEVVQWGPYQFPSLARGLDGSIELSFHAEEDAATAYGKPPIRAISPDGGRTWTVLPRAETSPGMAAFAGGADVLLPNGDRLGVKTLRSRSAAVPGSGTPSAELRLPEKPFAQGCTYSNAYDVYRLEDLPPEAAAGWMLQRLPAGRTQWQEERATVRLPGETRTVMQGVMWFPWLFPQMLVAPDKSLLSVNYTIQRVVAGRFQDKNLVTVLRSTDNGRTWDLWSEIPYAPDLAADPAGPQRQGFTEPFVNIMPDGTLFCLIRTTDGSGPGPLYQCRSTDRGKTWSRPMVFDSFGVWPQLLTLKNGVTLAAYGRPGLFVRATTDVAGLRWEDLVTVVEPGTIYTDTCSYAALLALDDHRALLAYSNFALQDVQGRKCKGIQVREIVTGLEERLKTQGTP